MGKCMRVARDCVLAWPVVALAQPVGDAARHGRRSERRVIVGAQRGRHAARAAAPPLRSTPAARGDAMFDALEPGRYTIHVEAPGFEPHDARDVRVRAGENRREVKLAIAKLAETRGRGARPARARAPTRAATRLRRCSARQQIDELPDDPDEMEQAPARTWPDPGAVLRVNGFRGGRLPPKDQIQQIRFRRNMFAADTHEPGMISVDIITKPGLEQLARRHERRLPRRRR